MTTHNDTTRERKQRTKESRKESGDSSRFTHCVIAVASLLATWEADQLTKSPAQNGPVRKTSSGVSNTGPSLCTAENGVNE